MKRALSLVHASSSLPPAPSLSFDEYEFARQLIEEHRDKRVLGGLAVPFFFSGLIRFKFSRGQYVFTCSDRAIVDLLASLKSVFYYTQTLDGMYLVYMTPTAFLSALLVAIRVNPYYYTTSTLYEQKKPEASKASDR